MSDLFFARKAGIDCPLCRENRADYIVAELPSGFVRLQDDSDYPGYCILVLRRHVVELFELTPAERLAWIEDVARIGAVIQAVCEPAKLNVFMFGNLQPHLHCHVLPRYPQDPEWGGPVTRPDTERRPMTPAEFLRLRDRLRTALLQG